MMPLMTCERRWGMSKQEIIQAFIEEFRNSYGKYMGSDITVARAVEVLEEVIKEEG